MKIGIETLKRIAKAAPELTMVEFVAVWTERVGETKRETERERLTNKRATKVNNEPTPANNEQQSPTATASQIAEKELFARGKVVFGKTCGGLITTVVKFNGYDLAAARRMIELAATKNDPREFVVATMKVNGNGARPGSVAAAGDDLIAAAEAREREANTRTIDVEFERVEGG